MLSDWKQMSLNDNYESWRQEEARKLEELVQKRFYYSQNPSNCDSAKYLRCTGEWTCGWGMQKFENSLNKFQAKVSVSKRLST